MRELAVLLDSGAVVLGPGWTCVADVMDSFHGFGVNRVYGTIVDAETLVQVYPTDGRHTYQED